MSAPVPAIEAVTFDYWDTLVRTDDPRTRGARRDDLVALFDGFGQPVDPVVFDAAFEATFELYTEHWRANRQFVARDGAMHMLTLLGVELDDDQREAVVDTFCHAAARVPMQLTDHAADTLLALADRGVRLGIVCDVGMTPSPVLRGWLADQGVLDLFDHWSFSDEVGYYKPAPEIFEHALAGLGGIEPQRAAHVGDLRRTDVAGAKAMGMTTVRYSGVNDNSQVVDDGHDRPEADHVIDDHARLLAVLGLT